VTPLLLIMGYFGAALEWSQAGNGRNHTGMGKKYDLEKYTAIGQPQQNGLPERDFTVQSSDADD
jgi:hypothetical protein